MNKKEKSVALFKSGYGCAQAVLLTFAEELNLNPETAAKLASSFGGGMGRLREVCGAVSALFMVAGLKYGPSDPNDHAAKTAHYELIQKLAKDFKQENGSIICRELLGLAGPQDPQPEKRTSQYYKTRTCADKVACAVEIAERLLKERG